MKPWAQTRRRKRKPGKQRGFIDTQFNSQNRTKE